MVSRLAFVRWRTADQSVQQALGVVRSTRSCTTIADSTSALSHAARADGGIDVVGGQACGEYETGVLRPGVRTVAEAQGTAVRISGMVQCSMGGQPHCAPRLGDR